jgi:hypothetical protein
MTKAIIIIILAVGAAGGYLYYDWHSKGQKMAAEPSITFYSWTDQYGAKHYTNTQPPQGARNINEHKGYDHIEQPLVVRIKNEIVKIYQKIKKKRFKKTDRTGAET